jgi:hypothetical protein
MYCSLQNGARLQLYGDGSWLTNQFIDRAFNRELARGAVLWGSGIVSEDMQGTASPVVAAASAPTPVMTDEIRRMLMWLFLFMAEGLMLTGICVLWHRRRKAVYRYQTSSTENISLI